MAKQQNLPEHVAKIKAFCRLLSSYNAQEIMGEYDGSGDSGDMTIMVFRTPELVTGPPVGTFNADLNEYSAHTQRQWVRYETFFENLMAQKDCLITKKLLNEFEDAMYEFLPGGWEINDGSYGEINIDVQTGSISVTHNERITDVHTTEETFD